MFFFVEKRHHLLQYNENLDAYLTSGSIKCIKKLHQLMVDPNTGEMFVLIQKKITFTVYKHKGR